MNQNTINPFLIKYKPKTINDFHYDDNIKELIYELINNNNLNILFYSLGETGKTSLIQTIVSIYFEDISPLDKKNINNNVIILNPLNEQGINYCRNELKIFCQNKCTIKNKKKIIIFDDIDLINDQIQQVIRNYFDKYSNNLNFILSCSNLQKVNSNIKSRLFTIHLNNITNNELSNIYDKIVKNENIIIQDNCKELILNLSHNSIRVLLCYLEKLKIYHSNITLQLCNTICTNINYNIFDKYTSLCKNNKLFDALDIIHNIYNDGYSVIDILDCYLNYIKITNIIEENIKYNIIILISKYNLIFYNIHEDIIELTFFTSSIINYFNNNKQDLFNNL
tara:strand:+ start:678 stop:1688 length:1011 start_codon:yes stop_codon:yes gene_type:complete